MVRQWEGYVAKQGALGCEEPSWMQLQLTKDKSQWKNKEEENLSHMKSKQLHVSPSMFPHLFGHGIERGGGKPNRQKGCRG